MSRSKLVTYTRWSPNYSSRHGHKITHIVIHHMAGCLTVQQCGAVFASRGRQASATYGVKDRQVGQYVDEAYRPWTTSSRYIDERAVTIEVSNSHAGGDWPVSDASLDTTIKLCADICKRNGIKKLRYTGDKHGNLHMHRWYAGTACPGPYLGRKFAYIAREVNKILEGKNKPEPAENFTKSKAGFYKVTPDKGLVLRLGPGKKFKKIKLLKKSSKVECFGYHTGKWYLVKVGSDTGYVYSPYLKKTTKK